MQKFQVIWTHNAQLDLESIIQYIQIDDTETAKKIFSEIKEACNSLYLLPERKRIVPELQQIGILKYREIIYKRWRIIYKIAGEKVYILLVVDSSRNLEDILFHRLMKSDCKTE